MIIPNFDPSKVPSPLAPVMQSVLASPGIVSPKRAAEIRDLVARLKVRLEVSDKAVSTDFTAHKDRRIRTSLRGLEHLWGTLHSYLHLLDLVKTHPGQLVDLLAIPEGQIAREFLLWAFGDPNALWLTSLPQPADTYLPLVVATNNMFVLSCGFILLHEIAHFELGHTKQSASNPQTKIRREYAADDWAVRFIIDGTDTAELPSRLYAIAATLGVFGGIELYGEEDEKRYHPFPPDRIMHFLKEHAARVTSDQKVISGCLLAAGVPIQAHLLKKGIGTMQPYQTFDEFFSDAKKKYPS
jgi:Peptidase U49